MTTRAEIERTALDLFSRRGFVETTVEDIAEASGISRRTFFRYFASKNDVVWGDFDALLHDLDAWLRRAPDDGSMLATLRDAVVAFNALPPGAVPAHRQRMSLILYVPALQAHSTLRYASWRAVVVDYAARRLAVPMESLAAQLVGHVTLATAVTAYEQWLADVDGDLGQLITDAFDAVDLRFPDR